MITLAIALFASVPSCRAAVFATPGDKLAGGKSPYLMRQVRPDDFGLAHRSWKLGSWVRVTCVRTGKSMVVQVIDRGPYGATVDGEWVIKRRKGDPGRWRGCADLTPATAMAIGHRGFEQVRLEKLGGTGATQSPRGPGDALTSPVMAMYHTGRPWATEDQEATWIERAMLRLRSISEWWLKTASMAILWSGQNFRWLVDSDVLPIEELCRRSLDQHRGLQRCGLNWLMVGGAT